MDQEPKYAFVDGRVQNKASGEFIPLDEPVFILRGRDRHAAATIRDYMMRCNDDEHRQIILQRAEQFEGFAEANADRMKEPDTEPFA